MRGCFYSSLESWLNRYTTFINQNYDLMVAQLVKFSSQIQHLWRTN